MLWPYRYPIEWMNNIIKTDKCQKYRSKFRNCNLVFLSRRMHNKEIITQFFADMNRNLNKNKWIIWEHDHNPETHILYNEYYCKLSITKYVIHFENYISAGQTIGEAAVYGIPVFSYSTKYLESALMPRFLFLNNNDDDINTNDIINKITFLEQNPFYYNRLKHEIIQRSKAIFDDYNYTIQNFIDDTNKIMQSSKK